MAKKKAIPKNIFALGVILIILLASFGVYYYYVRPTGKEDKTLTIYASPAFQKFLDEGLKPAFENKTGIKVIGSYEGGGSQYNKMTLASSTSECDMFLHACPQYIERGYSEGYFKPYVSQYDNQINDSLKSRPMTVGNTTGRLWYSVAWTPLVEIYSNEYSTTPDVATADVTYGLSHPILANNGVYVALMLDSFPTNVRDKMISKCPTWPSNAGATIDGVAKGTYDVAFGYEGTAIQKADQGAPIKSDFVIMNGTKYYTQVIMAAGILKNGHANYALQFIEFVLSSEGQAIMQKYSYRSPYLPYTGKGVVESNDVHKITYDWSKWQDIDAMLVRYEQLAGE